MTPGDAMAQAMREHEIKDHGVVDPEELPVDCLRSVAAIYDEIVASGQTKHVHRFRCLDPDRRDPECDASSLLATLAVEMGPTFGTDEQGPGR